MLARLLSMIALLAVAAPLSAQEKRSGDRFDQSGVPLEVLPDDPRAAKVVLVAGRASHGAGEHEFFAGTAILCDMLRQNGVFPVMARDGWPKNEAIFDGAKSVVFYMDGGGGHPIIQKGRKETVQKLIDRGVGFVNLHYAVEYPRAQGQTVLDWLGGYYETGYSTNPHWGADFRTFADHPIARGVKPFTIRDEWYFNIRFAPERKGVTPILIATPPDNVRGTAAAREFLGREEIVAWSFERAGGGRSFGFTGGHHHKNWGNDDFRRLVTNAILWTAKLDVPAEGAKVPLDPAALERNLDRKGG